MAHKYSGFEPKWVREEFLKIRTDRCSNGETQNALNRLMRIF